MDIEVRTLDAFDLDALSVYARLRRYAPERGSYLLESCAHKSAEGRYSVVGYRVRKRSLMPPGVDALHNQASNMEPQAAPESFAAALALAAVGYVSPSWANVRQKLPLFRDEGPSAQFMVGATVVVFDHHEGTVMIAGPRDGSLVDRCLWEIENGLEELGDLPASDGVPGEMQAMLSEEALSGRGARAKPYFGDELHSLVMAQCYFVPLGAVDAFDIYRALRSAPDAVHGYYVEFGAVMHGPDTRIAGIARDALHLRRRDAGSQSVSDAFQTPHPSTVGDPPLTANRVLRKLENNARCIWGGGVGYLCPGGEAAFVLANEVVSAELGQIAVNVGTPMSADTDPASLPAAARAAAARGLSAVHKAQQAAKGRPTRSTT